MPKLKEGTIFPTDEEDAAITKAALSDPDNPIWTDADFAMAKKRGRPVTGHRKEAIAIRLDPEITAYFKGQGTGWQTRINDILGEYVRSHK